MAKFRDYIDDYEDQQEEEESTSPHAEITPAIKSWLGDSAIQVPVYHGTNKKFDKFSYQKSQRFVLFSDFDVEAHGFFFTEDYKNAKSYGKHVITAFLKVKNLLLDPRKDRHLGVNTLNPITERHLAFILRHLLYNNPPYGLRGDVGVASFPVRKRTQYDWVYNYVRSGGLHWDALDKPQVVASMKRLGYDGTFVHENNDEVGRSIFVPDSDQILIAGWN